MVTQPGADPDAHPLPAPVLLPRWYGRNGQTRTRSPQWTMQERSRRLQRGVRVELEAAARAACRRRSARPSGPAGRPARRGRRRAGSPASARCSTRPGRPVRTRPLRRRGCRRRTAEVVLEHHGELPRDGGLAVGEDVGGAVDGVLGQVAVERAVLGQPAGVRADRGADQLHRRAARLPQRRELGGDQLRDPARDRVLQVGGAVEVPVEPGAGDAGFVGDLLGGDLGPVPGDGAQAGFDELAATAVALAGPPRGPAVGRPRRVRRRHRLECTDGRLSRTLPYLLLWVRFDHGGCRWATSTTTSRRTPCCSPPSAPATSARAASCSAGTPTRCAGPRGRGRTSPRSATTWWPRRSPGCWPWCTRAAGRRVTCGRTSS